MYTCRYMTLENKNNQEQAGVADAHQPFNPNDKDRIAQLDAKFGDNERKNRLGQIQHEGERSTNFEGSNIVTFKNSDGEYVKYALRRDKDGQLNGNTFKVVTREGGVTKNLGLRPPNYQEDSNSMIVGVQQMSKSDLDAMEEILKEHDIKV